MKRTLCVLIIAVGGVCLIAETADAFEGRIFGRRAMWMSQTYSWHGSYADPAWGCPVSVVVPPTAEFQSHYGWGVGNTRVVPIYHQFHRGYPGTMVGGGGGIMPAPAAPSDTTQMGAYYIRGPW